MTFPLLNQARTPGSLHMKTLAWALASWLAVVAVPLTLAAQATANRFPDALGIVSETAKW